MEEDEGFAPAQRWHFSFLLMRVLALMGSYFGIISNFFTGVAQDVTMHANYQMERDEFAADAGRELETLIEGPEED